MALLNQETAVYCVHQYEVVAAAVFVLLHLAHINGQVDGLAELWKEAYFAFATPDPLQRGKARTIEHVFKGKQVQV